MENLIDLLFIGLIVYWFLSGLFRNREKEGAPESGDSRSPAGGRLEVPGEAGGPRRRPREAERAPARETIRSEPRELERPPAGRSGGRRRELSERERLLRAIRSREEERRRGAEAKERVPSHRRREGAGTGIPSTGTAGLGREIGKGAAAAAAGESRDRRRWREAEAATRAKLRLSPRHDRDGPRARLPEFRRHSPLQRAILYREILGPPKSADPVSDAPFARL